LAIDPKMRTFQKDVSAPNGRKGARHRTIGKSLANAKIDREILGKPRKNRPPHRPAQSLREPLSRCRKLPAFFLKKPQQTFISPPLTHSSAMASIYSLASDSGSFSSFFRKKAVTGDAVRDDAPPKARRGGVLAALLVRPRWRWLT